MVDLSGAIQNTIPISSFNKGLAGKIFEEVRHCGAKVVMKNNAAECVLLSPEEYLSLMDEVNDARLLSIAAARMEHADLDDAIPAEELYSDLGLTREMIDTAGEVEFE